MPPSPMGSIEPPPESDRSDRSDRSERGHRTRNRGRPRTKDRSGVSMPEGALAAGATSTTSQPQQTSQQTSQQRQGPSRQGPPKSRNKPRPTRPAEAPSSHEPPTSHRRRQALVEAGGQRAFGARLSAQPTDENEGGGRATPTDDSSGKARGQRNRRRNQVSSRSSTPAQPPPPREPVPRSTASDLPTRIHEDIANYNYECVICTGEVLAKSRVWTCQVCWTVTHLSCVSKWYANQKEKRLEQLQQQQQQQEQDSSSAGDPELRHLQYEQQKEQLLAQPWRCPASNCSVTEEPSSYHCWCGKEANPKPLAGLHPHSCGQTCAKPRANCPHPCSLDCHAGPCPPCRLMGPVQKCFCGRHERQRPCSETDYGQGGWSCPEVCGRLLPCGKHTCRSACHEGSCGDCHTQIPSFCYCGKVQKELACFLRKDIQVSWNFGQANTGDGANTPFEGAFSCERECTRLYDCGLHKCTQTCHPQSESTPACPYSPPLVLACPCGQTALTALQTTPRQSCQDPIPTCAKICSKKLDCGHPCAAKCHSGACPACTEEIELPCRCTRTTKTVVCERRTKTVRKREPGEAPRHDDEQDGGDESDEGEEVFTCARLCRNQLSCGRHQCTVKCCPFDRPKAVVVKPAKPVANASRRAALSEESTEHICTRICGKTLRCGRHTCQQVCHRGPCRSCLEAIFTEISCACGRTVLTPPQPCGTQPPACRFPCTRTPACGHEKVKHPCHLDGVACPKCPFLREKRCVCGKQTLKNQPCWLTEVHCGRPCGKKLKCGMHFCRKPCHAEGECEEDGGGGGTNCTQACGRRKQNCEHRCTARCHTPFDCDEGRPCSTKTWHTCECQRIKKEVKCPASSANPWPPTNVLSCDEECQRQIRNAKLAEAFQIPANFVDTHNPYSDATMNLCASLGRAFVEEIEQTVLAFSRDPQQKLLRCKPMPRAQRQFLYHLAQDYGLDCESQDPEPHRFVLLFKTPRFTAPPMKTLGQAAALRTAAGGKLLHTLSRKTASAAATPPPGVTPPAPGSPSTAHASLAGTSSDVEEPFNALVLVSPRFGLTQEALEARLQPVFDSLRQLVFSVQFLPSSDEVLICVSPRSFAAAQSPSALEATLSQLKPQLEGVLRSDDGEDRLAKTVLLCRVAARDTDHDDSEDDQEPPAILRRERIAASTSGWNAVVGRSGGSQAGAGSWPRAQTPSSTKKLIGLRRRVNE